jgi:hypothetical protein
VALKHTNYCQIPVNFVVEAPAISAFETPKAELAAELTDSLENIRYLFEINAVIMVQYQRCL